MIQLEDSVEILKALLLADRDKRISFIPAVPERRKKIFFGEISFYFGKDKFGVVR